MLDHPPYAAALSYSFPVRIPEASGLKISAGLIYAGGSRAKSLPSFPPSWKLPRFHLKRPKGVPSDLSCGRQCPLTGTPASLQETPVTVSWAFPDKVGGSLHLPVRLLFPGSSRTTCPSLGAIT